MAADGRHVRARQVRPSLLLFVISSRKPVPSRTQPTWLEFTLHSSPFQVAAKGRGARNKKAAGGLGGHLLPHQTALEDSALPVQAEPELDLARANGRGCR